MPSSVAVEITLTGEERARLEAWARRRTTAQALALAQRSRIVLAAADGLKNTQIAERLGVGRAMVTKWRNRFAEQRLDGLLDEPRPGRPRTISDEQVDEVIVRTLETTPKDATHWSTRSRPRTTSLASAPKARPDSKPCAASNATSPGASGTSCSRPPPARRAPSQHHSLDDIGAAKEPRFTRDSSSAVDGDPSPASD
jgi:DNA-binding CsgD family transcriptional regulator